MDIYETGHYDPPTEATLARRMAAADRPGRHLWVMAATWLCADPADPTRLNDAENLLTYNGPGCFKCDEPYSPEAARLECPGAPDDPIWPG